MDDGEYPKCIYRDGGSELIWGEPVETLTVSSRGEEVEMLAQGWRLHPLKPSDDLIAETVAPRRDRPPRQLKADEAAEDQS